MTAGAEIHDGCLFSRENPYKSLEAGFLFRSKTWKAGCPVFCLCFLLEKLYENLDSCKIQLFVQVF